MNKEDIKHTKVWRINRDMVVADTIEDAITLYKTYYEYPYNEITSIELVKYYDDTALIAIDKGLAIEVINRRPKGFIS